MSFTRSSAQQYVDQASFAGKGLVVAKPNDDLLCLPFFEEAFHVPGVPFRTEAVAHLHQAFYQRVSVEKKGVILW